MKLLEFTQSRFTVFCLAIVIAYLSAKYLFNGSAANTLIWGLAVLIIGIIERSKREAVLLGALFGFVVSYAFLWFDDTSRYTLGKIMFLILLIIAPSLFGALCGTIGAWLGHRLRKLLHIGSVKT